MILCRGFCVFDLVMILHHVLSFVALMKIVPASQIMLAFVVLLYSSNRQPFRHTFSD